MTTGFRSNGVDFDTLFINITEFYDYSGLWGVGKNTDYNLGTGENTVVTAARSPIQTASAGFLWSKRFATGYSHSAAIKTDGTLWVWGRNTYGQLGDSTVLDRSTPTQIGANNNWSQVACGEYHTLATKTDGTLWAWGRNDSYQLGDGTAVNRSSPLQVGNTGSWKQIACGASFNIGQQSDGKIYAWGNNAFGQCGSNTTNTITSNSFYSVDSANTNWNQISCGRNHVLTVKDDNTLWVWGENTDGQLGDESTTHRSTPVQVLAGASNVNKWRRVGAGYNHSVAIKTDGTLWAWGDNTYGQLGDLTVTGRSSPVQNMALSTNWRQITSGLYFSAGIKTDGTLWAWGDNTYGQLGDGNTANRSSPVQISGGGYTWSQIGPGSTAATVFYLAENKW